MPVVRLADLQPNPMRDFRVDPVDPERIAMLKPSIEEDGFWGGVVLFESDRTLYVAAGLHRILAARECGIKSAELFVAKNMDEARLIRVYARENATQRGNSGTAQAGTVASTIRFLAKQLMHNGKDSREITRVSNHAFEQAQKALASEKGIGEPIITAFLNGIPGVTENSIRQQLAILKSSGDYARIIGEVTAEVERDNAGAIAAAEEAERERKAAEQTAKHERSRAAEEAAKAAAAKSEKHDAVRKTVKTARAAADAAAARDVTFDLQGVSKHLDHIGHLEAFRQTVTGQGIAPYLPVKRQAALAAELVKRAKRDDVDLSARYIREVIGMMVAATQRTDKSIKAEERAKLLRHNWVAKARDLQHHFARQCGGMLSSAMKLAEHEKARPEGEDFHTLAEFREAVTRAKKAIALIEKSVL
jgi:ParB-like nuclease domain